MDVPHEAILLRIFMSADDRYGVEEPLYRAIVMKAREVHLAGATVLKGPLGFGHSSRLHKPHFIATDERPVVIEICDSEEKINAFLPVLDEMMESGRRACFNTSISTNSRSSTNPAPSPAVCTIESRSV
jgi:uncharacterized protein